MLFPTKALDKIASMSREDLVQLLPTESDPGADGPEGENSEEELKCIELIPQQDFE
jgi:hypothetical protein